MIIAAALLAGTAVPAEASPLSERVPDVASRFCVDILSRTTPVPAVGAEGDRVFARYGLIAGVPDAAMQALGNAGMGLISRATLASGKASDGDFLVAVGGSAGPTCRVIVYRVSAGSAAAEQVRQAMTTEGRGWKALPAAIQSPVSARSSFLKRDAAGHPFLANLIARRGAGPVPLIANVAAIPPDVTIPQGF